MSYRLVPPSISSSDEEHVVSTQATVHPISGAHDTFRHGLKSAAQAVAAENLSPLQARLEKWNSTQLQMQQTMQRNTFGIALPLRQAMEMKIVSESPHHPLISGSSAGIPLGGTSNLAQEILSGTDESLDPADFMAGSRDLGEVMDVNGMMERSRGI